MQNCNHCGQSIQRTSPRANNKKYCTSLCRNKALYIRKGGKEAQRAYYDSKLCNRYNETNAVKCLICNRYYRQLGTHIVQRHQMTALEYKEHYDLERSKGLLAPDLRELKGSHAINNGTYKNLKAGKPYRYIKGDASAGRYKRSHITLERLREHRQTRMRKKDNHNPTAK